MSHLSGFHSSVFKAISLIAAATAASCGHDSKPASLMLEQAPAGAVSIFEMKSSSNVGSHVVVCGRIGGKAKPFSDSGFEFMLMDLSVPYCGEGEVDGGCPQPWDYCCEKKEVKQSAGMIARIPPSIASSTGFGPLRPLMEVVVVGTRQGADDTCTIEVEGVFVVSNPGG